MQKNIFDTVDSRSDADWIVKEFFNSIYSQGRFLWALPLILEKKGCGVNEDYCFFPDLADPDPEYHFCGVKIGLMDDEVVITDEELSRFVRQACDSYTFLHPEHKQQVADILAREGDS